MRYQDFVERHGIALAPSERALCDEAVRAMAASVDVHHDAAHVGRLLDHLDGFAATAEFLAARPAVDLKALLVALLWHDVWRSRRDPGSAGGLLWCTLAEGIGAARTFERAARRRGLAPGLRRRAAYAIRKHAFLQLGPRRSPEARALAALDTIDHFSFERLRGLERKFLVERPLSRRALRLARLALHLFVRRKSPAASYFAWTERRIQRSRKRFAARVERQVRECAAVLRRRERRGPEEYAESLRRLQVRYVFAAERSPSGA